MTRKDRVGVERQDGSPPGNSLRPLELPPELAAFLRGQRFACLMQATEQGETVFVVKAPGREIASVRGPVPIHAQHELYVHPRAPIIRMQLTIYDQPRRPLALEAFTNVGDPQQRAEFEALGHQDQLHLLFYDEQLAHRLSKQVRNPDRPGLRL